MLGVSGMLGSSGDGPAAGDGGAGPSSGEDERMKFEDSERNSGGNRWPRQETIALIKIRSDMDSAFRDSSLKGPLWDEVSRKLAELGYHRSAKKCKEKFENVYKYHKRTKDGRTTKSEGKTYRFFDQLEALDQNQPPSQFHPIPPPPHHRPKNQGPESPTPVAMAMPTNIHHHPIFPQVTITSTPPSLPSNVTHNLNTTITLPLSNPSPPPAQPRAQPPTQPTNATVPATTTNVTPNSCLNQNLNTNTNLEFDLGSSSPSSSEGEEDPERRRKRKRKWEGFFQKLMNEVIHKQEEMQKKFLETLERRERDRVSREEAWRAQEASRINREHELLAQERSMAAAKDSAVIAYLQKISDQNQQITSQTPIQIQTQIKTQMPALQNKDIIHSPNPTSAIVTLLPQPSPQQMQIQPYDNARNGDHHASGGASSARWPKAEIQALIQLRTNMDIKYQDNVPKGPLWEEISAEMKKIGYDRNAKRCKEKWENINKYFKKVKESNKKRPEDSKTCPYFHLLDQIYREKAKGNPTMGNVPMMVQPEQQWPQPSDRESEEMDGEDEEEEERE